MKTCFEDPAHIDVVGSQVFDVQRLPVRPIANRILSKGGTCVHFPSGAGTTTSLAEPLVEPIGDSILSPDLTNLITD